MEKALRLKTMQRVAWMAWGSLFLATATLTLSDSVNAAVVIAKSATVYVPPQNSNAFFRGYIYRHSPGVLGRNQVFVNNPVNTRNVRGVSARNRNGGMNNPRRRW